MRGLSVTSDYDVGMPIRTCLGCRATAERGDLVRIVAVDGRAVVDVDKALPGRGAHLHDDAGCLARALKRRAFRRALRGDVATDGLAAGFSWKNPARTR